MTTRFPLLWNEDLEAPLAWRDGRPLSRRAYLADVHALAKRLPPAGSMLNVSADRFRFAVGLGAAMVRGQTNLLPPNHTPDMVARLREAFTATYCLADDPLPGIDLPMIRHPASNAEAAAASELPSIDADTETAQVLTSGSTGAPVPHVKRWGLLVLNAAAEAERLAEQLGRTRLAGVSLVATVPSQHMYGFETTVLMGLLAGAAFDTGRPFYPADIARALANTPRPRILVTTPFHLKMLLESGVTVPPLDLVVCATAPLAPQLAARAEAVLNAPLMEIYGCTEAGQVATRRTTAGPDWRTYRDLRLSGDGERAIVEGGHVPQPTPLADVLEVINAESFRLLGRSNDLINVAGKRSSLSHLNFHLNAIEGIRDGAFWLPADEGDVVRLVAFVVAPEVSREHILGALRQRVDAAFLPRRIVSVPALPRDATGKLPAARLAALAKQWLAPERPRTADHSDAIHRVSLRIPIDHPSFAGHFPGRPLLPGVVLLAEVLEAALAEPAFAAAIGRTPRIASAKFLAPVMPGAELDLQLHASQGRVRFEVWRADKLAASGQFEIGEPRP